MASLYNLARMTTVTTGTGTITLGSAVSGYLSFAASGVPNQAVVSYGIADGANCEVGIGTYSSSGTTLTRNPIISSNSNSAISLSGAAQVFITALAQDIQQFLTPEMFGAVGDGSTDDTGAFTAFFAALNGSDLEGRLGGRTYNVSNGFTITSPIKLSGCGNPNTTIHNTNASLNVPIIHVTDAGAANGTELQDFGVTSVSGIGSSCAGIQIGSGSVGIGQFLLSNLRVTGTSIGIYIASPQAGAWMDKCDVNSCSGVGFWIDGGNMLVTDCYQGGCGSHGFYFTANSGNAAGLIVSRCTSYLPGTSNSHGFYFSGNSTYNLGALIVSDCVASEIQGGSGFVFDTYGANILLANPYIELAGLNASSVITTANADSIYFTSNNRDVAISNPDCSFGSGHGIEMRCGLFSIVGGRISQVNLSNAGSGSGIIVGTSGAVYDWNITGVNIGPISGGQNNAVYGICSYTNGSTGIVTGCVLHGSTAAYYNGGSSVTFANNLSV